MSNPFFIFTRAELIYLLAVFILGIILGVTLLNLYISQRIDQLILQKNELKNTVEEQQDQIKKLEENLKIHKQHFINKLTIKLQTDLNKHTRQDITQKVHKLLAGLMGQEISQINPLLLRDIINDRYIMIENNTYQLHLIYLVVKEELELYIKVTSTRAGKEAE